MEQAFASLLSPIPLIALIDKKKNLKKDAISISTYYNRNGDCFAAGYKVKLLNETTVKVKTLRTRVTV
jgi:hypothetical protein